MHDAWKWCLHGSVRAACPSSKGSKQTEHCKSRNSYPEGALPRDVQQHAPGSDASVGGTASPRPISFGRCNAAWPRSSSRRTPSSSAGGAVSTPASPLDGTTHTGSSRSTNCWVSVVGATPPTSPSFSSSV
eukprot:scaffold3639_cov141-Isochrysis_galbana.AAC.11